jgi:arylsulfatase I/J
MATPFHTPQGRGYDTGLSYFHHSNDYYTEAGDGTMCRGAIDIWGTAGPAREFNTSWGRENNLANGSVADYEETKFMQHVVGLIERHDSAAGPAFFTYAPHLVHEPLQVPNLYLQRLVDAKTKAGQGSFDNSNRLWYSAMVAMLDDVVGNVTGALKQNKLWDDCLFLFSSDNGGPGYNSAHTANNFPLRGCAPQFHPH